MATDVMDVIEEAEENSPAGLYQTAEESNLALRVQDLFRASWTAKQNIQLHEKWRTFDDYLHSQQIMPNGPNGPDDPCSNTNVIKPIIDSQISDLCEKPEAVTAKGEELSDDLYAVQAQQMLEYVIRKNKFKQKLELAEHDRLELGTSIYKVYFDEDALSGRGLPTYEIVNPANFFPDPKISAHFLLQEGEFIIHATWKALSWYRRKFKERGKYIVRQVNALYDPKIYAGDQADEADYVASQRALCLECYMRDEDGEMYCLTVSQGVLLQDSRKLGQKLQRRNLYPFVVIPCYLQRGILWGQGDVELLVPTQDLINDLDDQIRINARLMGNPQIVFGMGVGRGFNPSLWTSAPALRIPMRDQNAFRMVEAKEVSRDVPARREKAFQEADIISGRPDVTRGEQPSGVTAFRAIAALQQAGQKGVIHKKNMFKAGFKEVLELLYDEMITHWTDEMWIRVEGREPDYKFYDPKVLTAIPQLIPNLMRGENSEELVPLLDEAGVMLTRDAEFDLDLSIGDGLPNDQAFMFQLLTDLAGVQLEGKPILFWKEFRDYLRDAVGVPLKDDEMMMQQGQPMGLQPSGVIPGQTPMPVQGGGGVPNANQVAQPLI